MTELDIEALKRLAKDIDNPIIGMDSHRAAIANFVSQRHAIIAALEDRSRLRIALTAYGDHIPTCPGMNGGYCTCGWAAVRAIALEGRRNG